MRTDAASEADERPNAAPTKDDERVLVVSTRFFCELGAFQGFLMDAATRFERLFESDSLRFLRRGDAERDPAFKQLIPYILFTSTAADGRVLIFAYCRGAGQGEKRLRSKWSVGVGGHINADDAIATSNGDDLFAAGAKREIAEEVVLGSKIVSFERVGLVNDDSTEVGRVHLGVVCRAELAEPKLTSNEPNLLEAGFYDVETLRREIDAEPNRFESWTEIALRGLFPQK